jgi:hypothetical protein
MFQDLGSPVYQEQELRNVSTSALTLDGRFAPGSLGYPVRKFLRIVSLAFQPAKRPFCQFPILY